MSPSSSSSSQRYLPPYPNSAASFSTNPASSSTRPFPTPVRQRSTPSVAKLPQQPSQPGPPPRRDTLPAIYDSREWASEVNGEPLVDINQDRRGRLSLPSEALGRTRAGGSGGPRAISTEEDDDELEGEEEVDGEGSGKGDEAGSSNKRRKALNPGLATCRRGKRRCEPSPLVPPDHPDVAKLPCARCRRFALDCTRVEQKKRKGPPAVDLSAISDAVYGFPAPSVGAEAALMEMEATPMPMAISSSGSGGMAFPHLSTPMSTSGLDLRPTPAPDMSWMDDRRRSSALSAISGIGQDQAYSSVRGGSSHHSGDPSPSYGNSGLDASPSTSINHGSIPDNLDQVVNAPVVTTIIGLFFDYVYPLTPCLHRPTFLASLAARQDRTDPIFFALTLTVLASTLVQVPRSLINLDKTEVEDLARRCVRIARAKIAFVYEESVPVEINFVVMAYFQGIVHLLLGNNTAHIMCTSNAYHLALAMRLNEEASYEGLDPIESEIRRRTYWLLFQADKSSACMRARTINLRLEDAASLRLPAEVDDEQITSAGIMMQTNGRTPIIAGFNIVTNLFRIMNDALLLQRRKAPPTVDSILADLQNVNELREKVIRTTKDVSPELRLKTSMDSRVSSPAHDWEAKLEARFLDFFHSAGDETHTLNSYLVLQGNILVTQSVVRLVLLHSKEALLVQLAAITHLPVQGMGNLAGMQATEPAEEIACELLDGLNSLPVECVATNGPSLVQKVRFVAIQLMECSVAPSPTTTRAQKLLMQFLSVLSVIEGMYTFGKDISAE